MRIKRASRKTAVAAAIAGALALGTYSVQAQPAAISSAAPPSPKAVACNVDTTLSTLLDGLLVSALQRNSQATSLDLAVQKYSTRTQKGKFGAKDLSLNYFGFPRGFDYSEEGANLVLDQPAEVTNLEAATYGKQLRADRIHRDLVGAMLQLAAGLGSSGNGEAHLSTRSALERLQDLSGTEQAAYAVDIIMDWCNLKLPDEAFQQPGISLFELDRKVSLATDIAIQHDLSMIAIRQKLHQFADHSKGMQLSGKIMEGTVSAITMLGPGLGVPVAAQAMGATWGVANGGSEESKLLKELYYQRQIDSRSKTISAEAQLALTCHDEAVRTHNKALLVCSEAVIAQLVGAVGLQQILPFTAVAHGTFSDRTIAGATPSTPQ